MKIQTAVIFKHPTGLSSSSKTREKYITPTKFLFQIAQSEVVLNFLEPETLNTKDGKSCKHQVELGETHFLGGFSSCENSPELQRNTDHSIRDADNSNDMGDSNEEAGFRQSTENDSEAKASVKEYSRNENPTHSLETHETAAPPRDRPRSTMSPSDGAVFSPCDVTDDVMPRPLTSVDAGTLMIDPETSPITQIRLGYHEAVSLHMTIADSPDLLLTS